MDDVREVEVHYTRRRIPLVEKVCPHCGATFQGVTTSRFCSAKCRFADDWAKHGSERNARRTAKKAAQSHE